MSDDIRWYFAFRQTIPGPSGQWIACGPYDSYEQALEERRRAKHWDCEVSTPYSATSKKDADEIAAKPWNSLSAAVHEETPRPERR